MRKLRLVAILLLLFSSIEGTAESFRFRHLGTDEGLPSNAIRSIVQDKFGRLWIGTGECLCSYDGVSFKTHRITSVDSSQGTSDNYVNVIFEDSRGKLWLGMDIGIFVFDYQTQVFTKFDTATKDGVKIERLLNCIVEDKDHNIWCSTYGQGVFKYNLDTGVLSEYSFADKSILLTDQVYVDSENDIWVSGRDDDKSLFRYDRAKDTFIRFELKYEVPESKSRILTIFEDSLGDFWIGTWEGGLQKLNRNTGIVSTYLFSPTDRMKSIFHIHKITEYAPNQLLVGSDDGLSLLNTTTGEHQLFTPDESNQFSISNKFVYPIIKDTEGGIWIGTYYGGLNYIAPNNGQFEGSTCSEFTNSKWGNVVSRFCEDPDGNIWIATDDRGLIHYHPSDGTAEHYMPMMGKNSLSYHNIHALCLDGDDLWIGTYSGGLNVLDTKTGVFRYYTHDKNDASTIDNMSIYALFKDGDGTVWVGTMLGINIYDRENDCFKRMRDTQFTTIDIKQDKSGFIWFATQGGGLYRFNPENNEWKWFLKSNEPGSLISNQVSSIYFDVNDRMWLGTVEGLCYYDYPTETFIKAPLESPVVDIACVVGDGKNLWLTTPKGLIRYEPRLHTYTLFTKTDGLQSNYFTGNSAIRASDGRIYIGSVNGFNYFDPKKIQTNKFVPQVILTSLELYNKEVPVTKDGIQDKSIEFMSKIKLPYSENMVNFRYAAISYCTPEKNQYAYMLEGFDKDWIYVGNQTWATYTNIPIGKYTFRVKASNNDGVWNEEGASLDVVIPPPLLLSAPFMMLYIACAIVIIVLFIRFFILRSEKKHQKNIEKINLDKEKEVYDAKIQFFTTIAHEIRTPVSLIIAPLEKIKTDNREIPAYLKDDLDVMDRNSQRLLSLVNELLDFRKMEEGKSINLHFATTNINELINAVVTRFKLPLSQAGIHFSVSLPEKDFYAQVDSEAMTKVVSNLLSNARKYTKSSIRVYCTIKEDKHEFELRVVDNGRGISDSEKEKIFKPFYQISGGQQGTGLGLSIVKTIVEAHHGTVGVESILNEGATFTVTLPMQEKESGVVIKTETPQDEPMEESDMPSDGKPVMLIVEDNEEMLNFLSTSFADDYSVATARDGVEAMQVLESRSVSMVISDWMMPNMDGAELCKKVRSTTLYSHIPFILLTAKVDMDSKITSMDIGADAFIEKPFSMQYLKACIKNLSEMRKTLMRKFSNMPLVPLNSIAGNSEDEKFLFQMNSLIERNFSNPELSVNFLAEEMCISRSGLFAKIKTLTDVTPNELIQIVRLKKGAELLLENKYMVSEISYMVGFNNPSYFAKCFQKQFGVKPGEFVHSHLSTSETDNKETQQ